MIPLQIVILIISRLCAKRKVRFKGRLKWLSIIDIVLMQETLHPLYLIAWILWCFFWDVYDREKYGLAGAMAWFVCCLRTLWVMTEKRYIYFVCVDSSIILCYASFYNLLFKI